MAQEPQQRTPTQDDETSEGVPAPEGAHKLIDTDYVIGQDNYTASPLGKVRIGGSATTADFSYVGWFCM